MGAKTGQIHGRDHLPTGPDPIPFPIDPVPPATATQAPVFVRQVELAGDGKYNAFPYLCVDLTGKIWACYREGTAHLNNGSKVVIQTSTDVGATWTGKTTLITGAAGHDVRDPSICCTSTGRLIINYFEYIPLGSPQFPNLLTIYSDDNGASWSSPAALSPFTQENATSGGILQHSSGVLLWPIYGQNTGDTEDRAAVIRSSDNGASWSSPIYMSAASGGYSEMTFVEFADGRIAAFVRNNDSSGHGFIYRADSTDQGVTWTSLASLGFAAFAGRPSALLFPESQALILWYRNTTSPFKAAYRYSFDLGVTWSAEVLYSNLQYEYGGGYALGPNLVGEVVALENGSSVSDVWFLSQSVTGSTPDVPDASGKPDGDALITASGAPVWAAAGGDVSGPYTSLQIVAGAVTATEVAAANKDGTTSTPSMRTLGTGSTQAAAGNDSRLSDARTPTAHHTSHESDGGDAIKLDELSAPDDNTDLNASTSAHGLLRKLDNNSAHFLDGTGAWSTPAGGGGGGSVASDTIWDTKGDLAVASGADAASKLAVGSNGQVLTADSAQTLGVKWAAGGGGTTVATDTIWDAAGDLAVGTGADTAAKLAAGTNGRTLELVGGTPAWRGPKIYLNKPAGNITRAATTVGAFSTAWQITGVVVASGQNIRLSMSCSARHSATGSDILICFLRGSTQIATMIYTLTGSDSTHPLQLEWIDENPGAATYTYEVQAAMFTSGTLTVHQTNPTTDAHGGTSIFIAEVYTP